MPEPVTEMETEPKTETETDETLLDKDPAMESDDEQATAKEELERMRAALKKANAEARDYRLKAKQFEEAEEARKQAEMSELEKAQAAAEKAKAEAASAAEQLRATQLRHAVEMTARELGFHDPADALALADLSGIELGEDGAAPGVEPALKALAKAKPHLIQQQRSGVDPSPNGGNPATLDNETQARVRANLTRAVKGWM